MKAMFIALFALCAASQVLAADEPAGPEDASGLSKLPVLKRSVHAVYPQKAQEQGLEAAVVLELDIDAQGKVEKATVIEPANPGGYGFDEAAVEAVRQFEFEPAEEAGKPVPVRITYKYNFVRTSAVSQGAGSESGVPNLTGQVVEAKKKKPLAGIKVTVFDDSQQPPTAFEYATDKKGEYVFYDLAPGSWRLVIDNPKYRVVQKFVRILPGKKLSMPVILERLKDNQYDVLVEEQRRREEVNRHTFSDSITVVRTTPMFRSLAQTARMRFGRGGRMGGRPGGRMPGGSGGPGGAGGPPPGTPPPGGGGRPPGGGGPPPGSAPGAGGPTSAGFTSGMNRELRQRLVASFENTGGLAIRGAEPHDSRILLEGIEIPTLYHFGDLHNVLSDGMIEYLDFYPGNYPVTYGRASGAVVDTKMRKLKPGVFKGYVDSNTADSSLFVQAPAGEALSVALGGRYSYLDEVMKTALNGQKNVNMSSLPSYWDYQLEANLRLGSNHLFQLIWVSSFDKYHDVFPNPADPYSGPSLSDMTRFNRGILKYTWQITEDLENEFVFAGGYDEMSQTDLRRKLTRWQGREAIGWRVLPNLKLSGGVNYTTESWEVDRTNQDPLKESTSPKLPEAEFAELDWKPGGGFSIVPGLRVDHFAPSGQTTFDPRLGVRWALTPIVQLKAGGGLFHKAPSITESSKSLGNPDLRAEQAIQVSAGLELHLQPKSIFDLTGFYRSLSDLVMTSRNTVTRNGAQVPENFDNSGKGYAFGADVTFQHEVVEHLYLWVSYSFAGAKKYDPRTGSYVQSEFEITHIATLAGRYVLPADFIVGVRFRYFSGLPTTPIVGGVLDTDTDQFLPIAGMENGDQLPAFHQLDLRLDKRIKFDRWSLSAYVDLQNVYNRANMIEDFTYNFDYSQKRPRYGLPFLAILGMKLQF